MFVYIVKREREREKCELNELFLQEEEEERTKKTADFSLLNFFLQKSFRQKFKFHHTHYY